MKSSVEEIKGVRFLYLREKDPYRRGLAHGSLLREEIRGLVGDVLSYAYDKLGRVYGRVIAEINVRKGERLADSFSEEEKREMEGIAEGSGMSLRWILFLNAIYEIAISVRHTFVGCSFFAAPFKEGKEVVIGKTIDLYFEKKATEFITEKRAVFVYGKGRTGSPYLAPSLPGFLVTDSVITKKGVVFAVNDGGGAHRGADFSKTPITSIIRDLTKIDSRTPVWLSALKRVKSIRPFACLLSGGEKSNTFLIETCQGDSFVKRMDGPLVNTNHFVSSRMKEKWYVDDYGKREEYQSTLERKRNIEKGLKEGVDSLEEAVEVMKIHEKTFRPGQGSVSNEGTVQGFVFLPERRKILFPAGEVVPVTFYGKWREFTLDKIFERV